MPYNLDNNMDENEHIAPQLEISPYAAVFEQAHIEGLYRDARWSSDSRRILFALVLCVPLAFWMLYQSSLAVSASFMGGNASIIMALLFGVLSIPVAVLTSARRRIGNSDWLLLLWWSIASIGILSIWQHLGWSVLGAEAVYTLCLIAYVMLIPLSFFMASFGSVLLSFAFILFFAKGDSGAVFFSSIIYLSVAVILSHHFSILRRKIFAETINAADLRQSLGEVEDEKRLLARNVHFDTLTGGLKSKALTDRLHEEWRKARRYNRPLTLLVLGIDQSQRISQHYGYDYLALLTAELGGQLGRHLRRVDIFGRCDQELFMLILPETATKGSVKLAERLAKSFSILDHSKFLPPEKTGQKPDLRHDLHPDKQHGLYLTISCGIAEFLDSETPDDMANRAEAAFIAATKTGGSQCRIAALPASEALAKEVLRVD